MTVRSALFNVMMAATFLCLPLQCLLDASIVNVACTCIILSSALIVLAYLRYTTALTYHPLSSLALLGFCFSSQLGALLVQTLAATAVSKSLYDPLYTFGTLAVYQGIAVCMHVVYRFFAVRKTGDVHLVRGVLEWAGIYKTPSAGALWFMGCIGTPTFLFWHTQGLLGKIMDGFTFLAWAPFLIPFYSRFDPQYCNRRLNFFLLTVYTLGIGVLGVALNARGIMFAGAATVGVLYLVAGLRSDTRLTGQALARLALLGAILAVLSIPLSNLASAMAIARAGRGKVSVQAMMKSTMRIWLQPGLIAAYRADEAFTSRYSAYDEHYIANPMLARLVETKFYDNAFHFARTLQSDDAKARLRDVSVQFIWVILPAPVLSMLHIDVDKDSLDYSMGDYLAYLSRGVPLGGHKMGNMFAQGIALFGPLFAFMYALICLALYALMDLLTIRRAGAAASLSALGMLEIWSWFLGGITYEALHKLVLFFSRYFLQVLLIYVCVFAVARAAGRGERVIPGGQLLQRSF